MIMKMDRISKSIPKGKVTKSCARCRKHKTKCDQLLRKPLPCSNCAKKNLECILDVITYNPKRHSTDVLEKLDVEVNQLKHTMERLVYRKTMLINWLIKQNPSVSEIQNCLEIDDFENYSNSTSSRVSGDFIISSDSNVAPVALAKKDAIFYFDNFFKHYHRFLPIFPEEFYKESNVDHIYKESNMLFWCIILTSHLNTNSSQQYLDLSKHIKKMVVDNCWLNTPRSVYVLSSLLLLTTWPIPLSPKEKINDNLSVKYLSLMKNLSLQLGLHRLEFINEFLHKTKMTITSEINLNNLIRERIYKFITINSNYWLINLGLLHLNFNGFQEDYIINKATTENQKTSDNSEEDKSINSLLKVSIIQQRLNENLNNTNHIPSKLIHLNMFEVILNDLAREKSPIVNNCISKISVEYAKLQLYLYAFDSTLRLPMIDYKNFVYKALSSCYRIIDLVLKEFPDLYSVNQLPIHIRFALELATLMLTKIYYSPLLNSVEDYEKVKSTFHASYSLMLKNNQINWKFFNSRFFEIIDKFNEILRGNILKQIFTNRSVYILNKFNSHQVSNIHYEMIWCIYSSNKNDEDNFNDNEITWESFGIKDKKLIEYLDNISLI